MENLPRSAPTSRSARFHLGIAGRSRLIAAALGLCAAGAIAACATPRTPEATGYKVDFEIHQAKDSALPAVQPADVTIYDSMSVMPAGVRFERGEVEVAADFPSPVQPHRDVGNIFLHEIIGYSLGEDWTHLWDEPQFVAKRNDVLKKAAAKSGANAVFLTQSPEGDRSTRAKVYHAVSLSTAQPVYPSVDEVIDALHLVEDGYNKVHRFTAPLAELGARKPESVSLKAGHEYMLAMVFHPGLVDLGLPAGVSLGFFVDVERDLLSSGERPGSFTSQIDKQYKATTIISSVDGVFARGGAGTMGVSSRGVKVELVSRPAKLRFTLLTGTKGPQPIEHLGAGEADFIVFERAIPREQFVKEVCDLCVSAAVSCPKRQPLDTCEALRACFNQVNESSSICSTRYKNI